MRGASASCRKGAVCALASLAILASPAAAIEFFDDRLAIHGFYGMQVRSIMDDFNTDNAWDLTQWYHILNLEIEADIAPDGVGPIDLISAFGRIEVRYDCVWTRGCGIFNSANTYGDRSKRLPKRLLTGRRTGFTMQAFTGNMRKYRDIPLGRLGVNDRLFPEPGLMPVDFGKIPGLSVLSESTGPDGELGTEDDPFSYYTYGFQNPDDCLYGVQQLNGNVENNGTRNLPHTPACMVQPIAPIANRPNPMSPIDYNPVVTQAFGSGNLPLRPVPRIGYRSDVGNGSAAQGLWLPNYEVSQRIRNGEFDPNTDYDQNFSQDHLAWNRGASQQDEYELKELYFDIELFDSRLWLRAGKQTIVWSKTELFATNDQFNPRDLALGSLTSLEESRIGLWALRAVWSFYNVGPMEDVRLEVAFNFDNFEPADLGRCGEPYAPLPVCDKTWGLMAHGFVGDAIAGEVRPENPWNSWSGIEVGGRLEWRWDRYSFALTDFYGYNDFPYIDPIFQYSRNIDPISGRPRWGMEDGPCRNGNEASCLTEGNALTHHSAGQQNFHFICATSIGFNSLDLTACGQTVYNSQKVVELENPTGLEPRIMIAVTNALSGQNFPAIGGATVVSSVAGFTQTTIDQMNDFARTHSNSAIQRYFSTDFGGDTPTPLVSLSIDPRDGYVNGEFAGFNCATNPFIPGCADVPPEFSQPGDGSVVFWAATAIQPYLTDEQEALLGCGVFYGTQCDIEGIDLMNMEGSAQTMSWPLFEGTFGAGVQGVRNMLFTTDASVAQPGTVGYQGGPVCTRYEGGRMYILPGCRGPGDPGYDPNIDGTTTGPNAQGVTFPEGRQHPFTGQKWASEMAIVSWNTMIALITLSGLGAPFPRQTDEFDPDQPFRKDGCSFAAPAFCSNVSAYDSISGVRRNSVLAGGNARYGRRDFIWHGGGDLLLRYDKRNVLGFSMDFAEDFTKSNWGLEFTWINGLYYGNSNRYDATSKADTYNLTISVDRPTFINFLNQNRTFFINTQWFFQYIYGWEQGFTANGPFNVLATLTITTGYFQDRLLPGVTFVYDMQSNSGAALPEVTYRFTENFSASVGLAGFFGRPQRRVTPLYQNALDNRAGRGAYTNWVENGLSQIRERDELWLRVRYTF